jgi:predicted hydrolase (HD superfamily)
MITYEEFRRRSSFDKTALIAFAHGTLFEDESESCARVGILHDIDYPDYPNPSQSSGDGLME